MSRLRKEKNCLNCGHHVEEIYCPHCGQKNVVTHVSAFHAIGELIGDYFHADNKFLKSIPALLFQPGKMTNEFNAGKRAKYIHPFRLYIFISIVYFSISFLVNDSTIVARDGDSAISRGDIRIGDGGFISIQRNDTTMARDTSIELLTERAANLPASIKLYRDSVKKLPEALRPDFRNDVINRVSIKYKNEGNEGNLIDASFEKFKHTLPKLLFFLIPLAALLLKLIYIRRKRFYIDHLVHTLNFHSFIFLIMTIYTLLHLFLPGGILFTILFFASLAYFLISMKRVYGQSWTKTFFKSTLFGVCYALCLAFIFGIGFLYVFIYD
jgi:hypothetical protein